MSFDTILAVTQILAVVLAALAIVMSLRGIREQLWLTTFNEYTRRYADIMEDLPFDARNPQALFDLDSLPAREREGVLKVVRKYANLCSEEMYLHQIGRIDKKTWSIWATGIRDTMRTPCFRRGWKLMRHEYEFYPGFREMMDGYLSEAP